MSAFWVHLSAIYTFFCILSGALRICTPMSYTQDEESTDEFSTNTRRRIFIILIYFLSFCETQFFIKIFDLCFCFRNFFNSSKFFVECSSNNRRVLVGKFLVIDEPSLSKTCKVFLRTNFRPCFQIAFMIYILQCFFILKPAMPVHRVVGEILALFVFGALFPAFWGGFDREDGICEAFHVTAAKGNFGKSAIWKEIDEYQFMVYLHWPKA